MGHGRVRRGPARPRPAAGGHRTARSAAARSARARPVGLAIPGALFPVSIIVTGIAVGWARVVSRWSAAFIVVGAALFPASRVPSIPALSILADVVLLVGLASAGLALLAAAPRTGTAAVQPG